MDTSRNHHADVALQMSMRSCPDPPHPVRTLRNAHHDEITIADVDAGELDAGDIERLKAEELRCKPERALRESRQST